ncbi:MAG: hypothetical protein H7329_07800 [Opitutaceae bacterium]|nr:hypothetical protein [Cytophagales bacterium]
MIAAINNPEDVILFIKKLIEEEAIINPDNDFNSCINIETDEKLIPLRKRN